MLEQCSHILKNFVSDSIIGQCWINRVKNPATNIIIDHLLNSF